jgi:bifunctional N-acetylglucosamine-1-phosphate-uridyltransferase/glucosamine-1-phosphate-acetyltransferase GlmU-like protein
LGEGLSFAVQAEQKGTAHAVQVTEEALKDFNGNILVMAGDVPLITKETLQNLIDTHQQSGSAATVLTVIQENPFGYGRIIRDGSDNIRIVEEKDANEEEKKVTEVNSGTFCFDKKALFEALDEVEPNNSQGEYYLTDVLEIMAAKGQKVCSCLAKNNQEVAGVNTKEALEELENLFTAQASK